jgi:chorismate-pyruvate lyase
MFRSGGNQPVGQLLPSALGVTARRAALVGARIPMMTRTLTHSKMTMMISRRKMILATKTPK